MSWFVLVIGFDAGYLRGCLIIVIADVISLLSVFYVVRVV